MTPPKDGGDQEPPQPDPNHSGPAHAGSPPPARDSRPAEDSWLIKPWPRDEPIVPEHEQADQGSKGALVPDRPSSDLPKAQRPGPDHRGGAGTPGGHPSEAEAAAGVGAVPQARPWRWVARTLVLGTLLGIAMFATYLLAVAWTAPEFPS